MSLTIKVNPKQDYLHTGFSIDNHIDLTSYTLTHNLSNVGEKSILPELSNYPLTDKVKNKANEIYIRFNYPNHRSGKRNLLLYALIYKACDELNMHMIPTKLAEMCGITNHQIPQAAKMLDKYNDRTDNIVLNTPSNYLPQIAKDINLPHDYYNLYHNYFNQMYSDDNIKLDDFTPQAIAVVITCLFAENYGLEINTTNLLANYRVTNSIYNKIKNIIIK